MSIEPLGALLLLFLCCFIVRYYCVHLYNMYRVLKVQRRCICGPGTASVSGCAWISRSYDCRGPRVQLLFRLLPKPTQFASPRQHSAWQLAHRLLQLRTAAAEPRGLSCCTLKEFGGRLNTHSGYHGSVHHAAVMRTAEPCCASGSQGTKLR